MINLKQLVGELAELFGDRLAVAQTVREQHGGSEGHHRPGIPDVVVYPKSAAEVQQLVQICVRQRAPIVPFGAGTSLEGQTSALSGGVCADFSQMNQIIEIDTANMLCRVQPGVTREDLNTYLRDTGLFFTVDPGANATLGGMVATRASGTNAVRYGTMRENTLALTAVDGEGRLFKTGTRARKSAAGYDLTHLLVGSEGTLGIIVEIILRLHPVPEQIVTGICSFEILAGAVEAVVNLMQMGINVARLELLDALAIKACNQRSALQLTESPTLFYELHGSPVSVQEQNVLLREIVDDLGGSTISATDSEERAKLWRARHQALPAAKGLIAGGVAWVTDVCVPISHLADAITNAHKLIDRHKLIAPILGHVGDGNFHVFFILSPADTDAFDRATLVNEQMIEHALSVGGTCTGEHGIGIGKRENLLKEHGETAVAIMARIKHGLDPHSILNPGKIMQPLH